MTIRGREEAVTKLFARTLHMWIKEAKFRFNVWISLIHPNICLALTTWKAVRTGGWSRRQSPAPVDPVPQWGRWPDKQLRGCHTELTQTGPRLLIRDRQQSRRTRALSRWGCSTYTPPHHQGSDPSWKSPDLHPHVRFLLLPPGDEGEGSSTEQHLRTKTGSRRHA